MNFLSNTMYDRLKWIAQILLPAVGALYFALAGYWGLPKPDEVVGTIVAVDAFLGVLLGLSNKAYEESEATYETDVNVANTEDGPALMMEPLHFEDPERIHKLKEIRLKVHQT